MPWFKKRPDGVLGTPPGCEKVGDGTLDCPLEWWLMSDWGTAVKDGGLEVNHLSDQHCALSADARDRQVAPCRGVASAWMMDSLATLLRDVLHRLSSRVRQTVAPLEDLRAACLSAGLLCISEQDRFVQQKAVRPLPAGPASCSAKNRLYQHHSAIITQQPSQLQGSGAVCR